jgi:hypothetical protein
LFAVLNTSSIYHACARFANGISGNGGVVFRIEVRGAVN